jgi:hypothetical protein
MVDIMVVVHLINKGISPMLLMYFEVSHELIFHVAKNDIIFCNIFCFLA